MVCKVKNKNEKKNNKKEKILNRDQLIQFVEEYNRLYSVNNKLKRFFKNRYAFSIIIIFIPIILAFIISIVSLILFRKYIDNLKIFILIVISIALMIILLKINWKNLEKYYPEKLKSRDNEILELLEKNQIDIKNIKKIIKYFKIDIEYEKLLDNGDPIINSVSKFWHQVFFLILGVVISKFDMKEFKQEGITLFIAIMLVILVVGGLILTIRVWNYFEKKSSYFNRIQKLVLDLKQIDLLYNYK